MPQSKIMTAAEAVNNELGGLASLTNITNVFTNYMMYNSDVTITGAAIVCKSTFPGAPAFQFIVPATLTEAGGFTVEWQSLEVPALGTMTLPARPLINIDDVAITSLTKGFHEIIVFNTAPTGEPVYKAYLVR